jgi:hypothetical protein
MLMRALELEHPSLCWGSIRGTWRRVFSPGTPRDISRKALEMEYPSLYTDSVRGTLTKGSYTKDCERHITEGSGNGALLFTGNP